MAGSTFNRDSVGLRNPTSGNELSINPSGSIDTVWQDSTAPMVDFFFVQGLGAPTALSVASVIDDTTITVDDPTGCVAGTYIGVFNAVGNRSFFATQIGAPSGNVLSLDTPIDFEYQIGDTVACFSRELDVNGSVTPQIFNVQVGSGATVSIDITRIMMHILDSTSMDDAKFGGGAALTKGIVLRRVDGDTRNIWNLKTNGEIGLLCYDRRYDDKAPSGFFGLTARNTFAGVDKHGPVVRLNPGDELQLIIQDDLSGLDMFRIMAQGSQVTD